ncbi:type III secretion protein [Vibrio aestuarianus]|uniref:type III secretion protein n=1 Tax=Vibrio aestuarianus TaxID=28171 RepID=UPI0006A621DB|nr:type III secretion protein [Vibrio aestuarianus]KOE88500.1 type III secretion protein [Vibrio alginolyticus]NGZ15423.1 type III secretion protein [Vibrio aestuarianus]NKZ51571.1 type III secretion protein [Vibrio aestuarianus]
MKKVMLIIMLLLSGCGSENDKIIADFDSADIANKVVVLLAKYGIPSKLNSQKEQFFIAVAKDHELQARELLIGFNFYFQTQDLNDLLESKFASLSKLETVKSNLLESREIYNKISIIPNVLRANVIVTGEKNKRVSVLIISLLNIEEENKNNIEKFLKGVVNESDTLTISYFVQSTLYEKV